MPPSPEKKSSLQSRQANGIACEECRKRKLRCDRQRPKCSVCANYGVVCTITTARPARGPKKGHIKALQTRIVALEGRLAEKEGELGLGDQINGLTEEHLFDALPSEEQQPQLHSVPDSEADTAGSPDRSVEITAPVAFTATYISDMTRAELDQLYFDRVHVFAPIVHQHRYSSWAKQSIKTGSRKCLQYAMWTMAASSSGQLEHLRDDLYETAKKSLEELGSKDEEMEPLDIAQAQAWLLLAMYEFVRTYHRRGWMSAGRAFRLMQLMRLYELDNVNAIAGWPDPTSHDDWTEREEKRRTFWMAYCLDRVLNIHNGWPITLNEQVVSIIASLPCTQLNITMQISTRLPAPETEFQSGQPVVMSFLSEVIGASEQRIHSSFTECIIFATICGRSLSHGQQCTVERVYRDSSDNFWDRHQWLDTILTKRMQILSPHYPYATQHSDPMLLFTNMLAQTTVLHLHKVIQSTAWETDEYRDIISEYGKRSLSAAQEMVSLAKASLLNILKVHPFTPIPLSVCAEFLTSQIDFDGSSDRQLQEILGALRGLKGVNNLAQNCLDLFECEGMANHSSRCMQQRYFESAGAKANVNLLL